MTKDGDALPVKRSKHFADKDTSAKTVAKESGASTGSKLKSPAKPAAAKPVPAKAVKGSPAAAKATTASPADKKPGKAAGRGRKAIVIDDDSDDDFQVTCHQLSD